MSKTINIITWIFQGMAALILLQALHFKFFGTSEYVYIFELIGLEPAGRILLGIFELVTTILLLTPRYRWMGAIFGIAIMIGAITFHMTILGLEVQGDGGFLFGCALSVLFCCTIVLMLSFREAKDTIRQIVALGSSPE